MRPKHSIGKHKLLLALTRKLALVTAFKSCTGGIYYIVKRTEG